VSETSAGRESPLRISGKVILVMSGRSRKMYQNLEPKTEGVISVKRSKPQDTESTPHDTSASLIKLAVIATYKVTEFTE
jgi:hypothetical protein